MTVPDGFLYIPDFLTLDEQADLLRTVWELDYQHDTFRGQRLKRGYAQFGYAYVSTGRRLTPAEPIPPYLAELAVRAAPHCPGAAPFNQCIATWYPENAGIGWHTDAPTFGDCILAVSLGGIGCLQFRRNGSEEISHELDTTSGSLYRMQGPARWDYQHQVLPVESVRFSLTYRHVPEVEREGSR